MIIEIILVTLVIVYYLFSVFLMATLIQDINKRYTDLQLLGMALTTMVIAPIAVPIMLAIKLGEWIQQQ